MGIFLNTLVIRQDLEGDPRFTDLLKQVKQTTLEAFSHQRLPFEKLVDALDVVRDPSHSPLFQVMFDLENTPSSELELLDLTVDVQPLKHQSAKFDLTLDMAQGPEGLTGRLDYCTDLFSRSLAEALVTHFTQLLRSIVTMPQARLSELEVLSPQEKTMLLIDCNDTEAVYPKEQTFRHLFEGQVLPQANQVAVVFQKQTLTYQTLNSKANRLAHSLVEMEIGSGVRVGIYLPPSLELMIALLGVMKAGATYVPLEISHPTARINQIVEDAEIELVLLISEHMEQLSLSQVDVFLMDDAGTDETWLDEFPETNPPDETNVEKDLLYILYTSGSTGKPKGVMVPHRAVVNYLDHAQKHYFHESMQGTVVSTPLCFDATLTTLYPALCLGKTVVLLPTLHDDLGALSHYLFAEAGDWLFKVTPAHLEALVHQSKFSSPNRHVVVVGGEALHSALLLKWKQTLLPHAVFVNEYGPTETVVGCSVFTVGSANDVAVVENCTDVPIGRGIQNTTLYVVDSHGQLQPMNAPGELLIGGAGVTHGYVNRPSLTEEKFKPHPFSKHPNERVYRTGDLVRWRTDLNETNQPELEFLGRMDDQVKLRGFRVELGEIETRLSAIKAIQESVVLIKTDAKGHKTLVAYIVSSEPVEPPSLQSTLRHHLPEYMVPSAIVSLEKLPLTANGKVDKKSLLSLDTYNPSPQRYTAPRNEIEAQLIFIFSDVLIIQEGRPFGVHDNFFEFGGDSILSIQIVSRASQVGLHFKVKDIFDHQTVAKLASAIDQNQAMPLAEQSLVQGEVPLSPIQSWFFEEVFEVPSHWNQAVLLRCPKTISTRLLQEALQAIVMQHDALRLRFEIQAPSVRQYHSDSVVTTVELVDLSHSDYTNTWQTTLTTQCSEIQPQLSLDQGPILRMIHFQIPKSEADNRVFWVAHHLVIDGVSWRILLDDLQRAIVALQQQQTIDLGLKGTSFQQYVAALRTYAGSDALQAELPYWQSQVASTVPPLPKDKGVETQAGEPPSYQTISVSLAEKPTQQLLQTVHLAYRTGINDLLLVALTLSLKQWTGHDQFQVMLEGHGREDIDPHLDFSRTVGWFTSLFPVLLSVENEADLAEVIKSIKEQLRQMPYNGIGYGILRYLHPDAAVRESLTLAKPFSLVFNYLGQLDQTIEAEGGLRFASEATGVPYSPANHRTSGLEINASVMDQKLQVQLGFHPQWYRPTTIETLATSFLKTLETLIDHCLLPESKGVTPSDFPLAHLSQEALDTLVVEPKRPNRLDNVYPLTPLQEGILFHTLHDPQDDAYLEQLHCEFTSAVDVPAFEEAWQQLFQKHSVFRSSLVYEGLSQPLQRVYQTLPLPFEFLDFSEGIEAERLPRFEAFCQAERQQGLDLTQAPLMRIKLVKLNQQHYGFIWTFHHVLIDGWSLPVLFQELFYVYHQVLRDKPLALGPEDRYDQFIKYLHNQDRVRAESFWRNYLLGLSSLTPIPVRQSQILEKPEPNDYQELKFVVSQEQSAALEAFVKEHHLTMSTVVQGLWALILQRYSQVDDVVFGVTVSGRPADLEGIEQKVGMFINTLPVRVTFREPQKIVEWLQQLQEDQLPLHEFQYSALTDIQNWSGFPPYQALFDSIVVFENYPLGETTQQDKLPFTIENLELVEHTNYPLSLVAVMTDRLILKVSYNQRLYAPEVVERLLGHLNQVLTSFVSHPQSPVNELEILTPEERHQLLIGFNDTQSEYPAGITFHALFERHVRNIPTGIALEFEGQTLTYRELNQQANPLPPLVVQYADYAHWQRQWLQGPTLQNELDYWRKQLAGTPTVHSLSLDRPRPELESFVGKAHHQDLPTPLVQAIQGSCQENHVTLFMFLQTAFALFLGRYSQESDIIMGTPIAGHTLKDLEPVIGFFVNTLVIRTSIAPQVDFTTLLAQNKQTILDAYSHQQVPFDMLVEELKPERHLSHGPIFQIMFGLQNDDPIDLDLPELHLSPIEQENTIVKCDLELEVIEHSGQLTLNWMYNTDLFFTETIERMAECFSVLLYSIAMHPEQSMATLPLLSTQDQILLLETWSGQSVENRPLPEGGVSTLPALFESQVLRTPEQTAVVLGDEQLTYQELNQRANQIAYVLIDRGIQPATKVGLCVERSIDMLVGMLGILKAGGTYVPIDPNYPEQRQDFLIDDANITVLVTQAQWNRTSIEDIMKVLRLDEIEPSTELLDNPALALSPEQAAYIIYTSGSTGIPKGVVVSHESIAHHCWAMAQAPLTLTPQDRVLQFTSLNFDPACEQIFATLFAGATLILRGDAYPSPTEFYQALQRYEISVMDVPPAYWVQCLQDWNGGSEISQPSALRTVILGGEAYPVEALSLWQTLGWESIQLFNAYGPTETTVTATLFEILPSFYQDSIPANVPIGAPVAGKRVYVLDAQQQLMPIGIPGELYIGGTGLAQGYLGRPELTDAAFLPDPFIEDASAKLYRTGDLVRYGADGNLEFLGRLDHQVKIRGFRIELGEIEKHLLALPDVAACAVLAKTERLGQKTLVAYLVCHGDLPDTRKLQQELGTQLPHYMIPTTFLFLDKLPLADSGQVDQTTLLHLELPSSAQTYVAPRTEIETQLVAIFRSVLKPEADDAPPIGVYDNFFDLGGHSLLAILLVAQLKKQWAVEVSLTDLFQSPTIAELALLIQAGKPQNPYAASLIPIQTQGDALPLFIVAGTGGSVLGFYPLGQALDGMCPLYGLQPPELNGNYDPLETLEALATHYIQALKTLQPKGPYRLIGHSFGTEIVYEMAGQLERQSERVQFLGLLDTPVPDPNRPIPSDQAISLDIWHVLVRFFGLPAPLDDEAYLALSPDKQRAFLHQQLARSDLDLSYDQIERLIAVYTAQSKIRYTPSFVLEHTPLLVFKSDDYANSSENDALGWEAYSH